MAEVSGNIFLLKMATTYNGTDYTTVAACKALSVSFTKAQVDITTKDTAGWLQLLAGGGQKSVSVETSGIWNSGNATHGRLVTAAMGSTHWAVQVTDGTNTWTGSVHFDEYKEDGEVNGVKMFSTKMTFSGTVTYA